MKRYVLDGYANVEYRRETKYNRTVGLENTPETWSVSGAYNHKFSPSFDLRSTGSYVSSSSYYSDYSNNLEERLNRQLKSQANFTKKFGKSVSLAGSMSHTVNLDTESRTDLLPSLSLSLPTVYLFGNGSKDADGRLVQKWYNSFTLRYNPSMQNYSARTTIDSVFVRSVDTTYVTDTLNGTIDTVITTVADTLSYRTRKEYTKMQHNPRITLPAIRLGSYLNVVPSFSYSETWFRIWETDQSLAAGIDATTTYRTYSYSGSVSANTALYGTIYPNVLGLNGLRHVFTPEVSYSWSPDIQRHSDVRSYAGGGAASTRRSAVGVTIRNLLQAKVASGAVERNLDLLSVSSSFSYNFEADERPLSNLNTSFQTSSVPGVSISGSMVHTFYDPQSGEEGFLSPWLLSFAMDVSFNLAGRTFLFTDATGVPQGADSVSQLGRQPRTPMSGRTGWNLAVSYSFSESGRHSNYSRRSFVNFTLGFNLTPVTSVSYRQQYDIVAGETVNASVNIVRQLHCWSGSLHWVPIGLNRGFGFELRVIDLPDIKLDSGYDSFLSSDLLNR